MMRVQNWGPRITGRPIEAEPGTVLDQKPKGDARVKQGTRVDLLVAAEVQGGTDSGRCFVTPSSIPAGGQAEIRIGASSGTNSPVTGASVRIMFGRRVVPEQRKYNGSRYDGLQRGVHDPLEGARAGRSGIRHECNRDQAGVCRGEKRDAMVPIQ